MLLGNQPEHTTRLKLFNKSLKSFGYNVLIPSFKTRNWMKISQEASIFIKKTSPDIVHIFNVPDIVFRDIPKLKEKYYKKLIYDYRSPWGIELQLMFKTRMAKFIGEYYEKKLVKKADIITTVNTPLMNKIKDYDDKPIKIIENYPSSDLLKTINYSNRNKEKIVLFLGMVSKIEGSTTLKRIIANLKENTKIKFWIVGTGPELINLQNNLGNYNNVEFFGWQSHEKIPNLINRANICLVPREKTIISKYANDKSVWKINEYLNLGKKVIASGISLEEKRKNLIITSNEQLEESIISEINKPTEELTQSDYRLWETYSEKTIKEIYSKI